MNHRGRSHLRMDRLEIAELRASAAQSELAARDKTIAVLIARVEGQFARPESAIAVLEQNISLEQKVQRRTQELQQSHESLSAALLELKMAQAQLLESSKLQAIGQLAAGVAHEINTPVQYVADNTSFLKDAFDKLAGALDDTLQVVEQLAAAHDFAAAPLKALSERFKTSNLVWVRDQIPLALDQSLEGLERVTTIVSAMKEFSHPSASEKQLVDLHEAIQTTITVARHEWKYVADVETRFDPAVPLVPCLRNEFNQVILNLIVNAAHAIAERNGNQDVRGTIAIATELVGGEVEIRIRDDGTGIANAICDRVYDPFFTTKPVGKGTGQGLAIARSVISGKHGGTIRFETALGEGSCFFVRLPIAVIGPSELA